MLIENFGKGKLSTFEKKCTKLKLFEFRELLMIGTFLLKKIIKK